MAKDFEARVIRAYSLPVVAFDHLKGYQRLYQNQVDPSGDTHTVTNSEALTRILHDHSMLGLVAASRGLSVRDLCRTLAMGDLVVTAPVPDHVG